MEEYYILNVEVTDTLQYWGYGVEMEVFLDRKDAERIVTTIEMEDMKDLNVIMRGRKPSCFWCQKTRHLKKDCEEYKKKMEEENNMEKRDETEANVHKVAEEREEKSEENTIIGESITEVEEEITSSPKAKKRRKRVK